MTSTPAPDLNNIRFSRARTEEFGWLKRANTYLLLSLVACSLALAGAAWVFVGLKRTIADWRPAYIRINDVGKMDFVYYHDANYQPQAPEVRNALEDFTVNYFTHMKGQIEAYWHSKYLLSGALQQQTYQEDIRTKSVEKTAQGIGLQNDVTVNRITLLSLTPQGGVASVDFSRNYFDSGIPTGRTENDTVTYYFSFLDKVPAKVLRWNPIGIVITSMPVQESLTK